MSGTRLYTAALVAQGIEQRFPKPCVAGSNPAGGTHIYLPKRIRLALPAPPLHCGCTSEVTPFGVAQPAARSACHNDYFGLNLRLHDRFVRRLAQRRPADRLQRLAGEECVGGDLKGRGALVLGAGCIGSC
jgi:hypothetical protein